MKHRFKSIDGAVRRIRELEKIIVQYEAIVKGYDRERKLLARLAATGPAFDSPLGVYAAEQVRDKLLREMRMNPDGSLIKIGGAA